MTTFSTSTCTHMFTEHGKMLSATICLDWRKCCVCGTKEYKGQNEHWSDRNARSSA